METALESCEQHRVKERAALYRKQDPDFANNQVSQKRVRLLLSRINDFFIGG